MSTDGVVIWGELLWDRFPDGDQLGGAPANVAWHLGQAGGWAQLVTRVGDDADGHRAIARLGDLVDTSLVQLDPERATGEVTVHVVDGEPRYTLHRGRAWERIECTDAVKAALDDAGVVVYGTLAQRTPEGLAGWRDAIAAAKRSCLRVCDLNLRAADQNAPAIGEALDAADVIKVNDKELALLREWFGWPDPIAKLRADRRRVIAVTHGAAGSTLYGEAGAIEVPGFAARPGGDNVGCGDAYLAILVLGLTLGWDLPLSGRIAARWAAEVAGVRGATPLFSEEQIAALLELA
ncbi:MAG: carbohydrate kinase [Deltaproteobacteria bacterium]|nr:carbohydrate kinase [Deltaproteobacteria bacterium]MDQ3299925.1 PfkB family carbohydrate kinase [Myxococcota bacterium]